MPSPDTAATIKAGLKTAWATDHPTWTPVLHVDDDYQPSDDTPTLLVADDGGPAVRTGPWPWQGQLEGYSAPFRKRAHRRPVIRLTAFAAGRSKAREVVDAAADWLLANRTAAGITRIDDMSDPLMARDRDTGAYLASITMPVIVRPV